MLSNTATPKYYGAFRDAVVRGEIPVCETIEMEMNRIDSLIADPEIYYDEHAIDGFIEFCESELTLSDGSPLNLLPTFKLWAEQVFGWYYFVDKNIYNPDTKAYEQKRIKKRLVNKQILIVARGAAKSMYDEVIQAYFLTVDTSTTHQITVSPTMKQSEEVMGPFRTAIQRSRGPYFKFLTDGSINNTTGAIMKRQKLCSTKMGIQNFMTGSLLEVRPMSIDKLQGLKFKIATIDEWLSGDVKEDVIGAIEQGASKNDDYLIIATSSEGTVRNGPGDSVKMEIMSILKGEYYNPHVSIWYYKLDDIQEVSNPAMWLKANPNLGVTVSYETYQLDVDKMEANPLYRNDLLAKRFGIPMEGYTYFFTYEETLPHDRVREYPDMCCAMGCDFSQGDDFCAFTWLFPLPYGEVGVKTRSYISSRTYEKLPMAMHAKYDEFIREGSLVVMEGTILDMMEVYEDVDNFIMDKKYVVQCLGYDVYNSQDFIERWCMENGEFGVIKVKQGARTESVPLGELKKMASDRLLLFDQSLMQFTMGNCIVIEDNNGNRKLLKLRYEAKIDNVSAMMDAWVAYKLNKDAFEM